MQYEQLIFVLLALCGAVMLLASIALWRNNIMPRGWLHRNGGQWTRTMVKGVYAAVIAFGLFIPTPLAHANAQEAKQSFRKENLAGMALFGALRQMGRVAAPSSEIGAYEYLRPTLIDGTPVTLPQATDYGVGMSFNADTGAIDGSAVDTTQPTWAGSVTLTTTGTASGDMAQLNNKITELLTTTPITQNTVIYCPPSLHTGTLQYIANSTGYWLGIVSANYALLPLCSPGNAPGTYANRLSPADFTNCFKLSVPSGSAGSVRCIGTDSYIKRMYMRGMVFTNPSLIDSSAIAFVISPDSDAGVVAAYPEWIIFQHCGCDYGGDGYGRRPFWLGGKGMAVVDGYFYNYGSYGSDTQMVLITAGAGPYRVHNNYSLQGGSGENILSGGVPLRVASSGAPGQLLPGNQEWSGNYLSTYTTAPNAPKKITEVKMGFNICIYNNRGGDFNGLGQNGHAMSVKLTDQGGASLYTDTHDITIFGNWMTQGNGFIVSGSEEPFTDYFQTRNVFVGNNLFPGKYRNGYNSIGVFTVQTARISQVNIMFNTSAGPNPVVDQYCAGLDFGEGTGPNTLVGFGFSDNMLAGGDTDWSVKISPTAKGLTAVARVCATPYVFARNVVPSSNSEYSTQIRAGNNAGMGFTDYDGDDYTLTGGSPGKAAGLDGHDVGVQFTPFTIAQARVMP